MIACPTCHETMERVRNRHGIHHRCATCHGHWVGMGVLRKSIEHDAVNELWRCAYDKRGRAALACPVCDAAMTEVSVLKDALNVEVCTRCHMAWFDGGELDAMPVAPGPPPKPEMSPKAKATLAFYKVKQLGIEAELERMRDSEYPDEPWKILPSVLGLPVEMHTRSLTHWPLLTWLFGALLVLVHVLVQRDPASAVSSWGFLPADPFRHQGLTLWSSMLLHGGWIHLLGNLYFLLLAGDDVEDHLGIPRYVLVLLAASAAGCLAHWAGDPRGSLSLVGASGAISGVMMIYAMLLPHARIGLPLRFYFHIYWVSVPAWGALLLWMGWQLLVATYQLNGFGNVSALAHLGGVLAGLLAWLAWRDHPQE